MSPVQASCPACGAAITFKVGSAIVTVCEYCRSVVARGDRQFEDLGKVADLIETGSVLDVWLQGRYQGVPFELTGRAQLGHEAGGVWDEWYAAFADGRWGWLAEAQGHFYLTFAQEPKASAAVPPFAELAIDQSLRPVPGSIALTVAEKGQARALSAKGEIPYRLVPNQVYHYADLSGPGGEFGTIDYGETPPSVYLGCEVTLEELGIPVTVRARGQEARQVEALHLSCPQCGGALDLRAPDRTERVGCPNCGSLLDVEQGQLRLLKALEPQKVSPRIPLGAVGKWQDTDYTLIGFLRRSVEIEKIRYFWDEYLLYQPHHGFRWLVCSDKHWSFVEPLPPGGIHAGRGKTATYQGKDYKLFQKATARVEVVLGEFYWKVQTGEEVQTMDFVRPPEMLSREATLGEDTGEINWSLGTYVPVQEVERAFGLTKSLPTPWTVAPNQPFAYWGIYRWWGLLVAATFLLGLLLLVTNPRRRAFDGTFRLEPMTNPDQAQVFFSEPFELKGHRNLCITAQANVNNSWLWIDGDLVDEQSGLVQGFSVPVEYYHGVEDGEAWSEGGPEGATYLSAVPAGQYSFRLEVHGPVGTQAMPLYVHVAQGVPRWLHFLLALLGVSLLPCGVLAYHLYFEHQRWQDSNVSS